jgi:eukaryotic-like serine/threonine-protein kinase
MKCPFCGTDNPAGETFCTNCGGHLQGSPTDARSENVQIRDSTSPTEVAGSDGEISASHDGQQGNSTTLHPTVELQKGRYVVEKILGQGGMGAAVLARDTRIANKPVVIKELISDGNDPQQRQEDVNNFTREVKTLATLDHPLIPTVTDSFQEGSRYYMVQEYAPGENLEDYLERVKQPMPEQEALTYISQVLDILDYLGQQKPPIIHRDIKPANIIISSRDKRARLVDFGIARGDEAKQAQRKQTSALGTPGYAPPEQYQGNADTRSDIYALAATLHHLLTNRDPRDYPPFNYPPVRSINPKISPDLERVLEKALTMDIEKRYQSAEAMKQDIDEILQLRFHTTGDTSSYVLNPSRPIKPPPKEDVSTTRAQSEPRPRGYGPVQSPPRYQPPQHFYDIDQEQQYRGYRPQQRQQQQMYPPQFQPRPDNSGNYVWFSLALLIVVVVLIAVLFFILPAL